MMRIDWCTAACVVSRGRGPHCSSSATVLCRTLAGPAQHSSRIPVAQNSSPTRKEPAFGTAPTQHPGATPPRPASRASQGGLLLGCVTSTPRSTQQQPRKWGPQRQQHQPKSCQHINVPQSATVTPLLHAVRALHRRRGTSPKGSLGHLQHHRNPVDADIQRETGNNPRTGTRSTAAQCTVNNTSQLGHTPVKHTQVKVKASTLSHHLQDINALSVAETGCQKVQGKYMQGAGQQTTPCK